VSAEGTTMTTSAPDPAALRTLCANALRVLAVDTGEPGAPPSREAFIAKYAWSNWRRDFGQLAADVLGPAADLVDDDLLELALLACAPHEDPHQHQRDHERDETGVDGFLTKRRTHNGIFHNACGSRQFTDFQHIREIVRFFQRKLTGDAGISTRDLVLYDREGIDVIVEYDGYRFADVLTRQPFPGACAFRVHTHANLPIVGELAFLLTRVDDRGTVKRSLEVAVRHLDGNELQHAAFRVDRLHRPERLELTREFRTHLRHGEVLVHTGGVLDQRHADDRPFAQFRLSLLVLSDRRGQHSEEGILTREVFERLLSGGIRFRGISAFFLFAELGNQAFRLGSRIRCGSRVFQRISRNSEAVGIDRFSLHRGVGSTRQLEGLVGLLQHRVDLGVVIGLPELELRRSLEELANTLGFFDTRKLDEDSSVAQLLYVRLGNAELVDTGLDDLVGTIKGGIRFRLNDLLHFLIRRVEVDALGQFLGRENGRETTVRIELLEFIDEQGYEVLLTLRLGGNGVVQGLVEGGVRTVVGHRTDQIHQRHFKGDVHAAFEVKTEVQFVLFTLLVRVTEDRIHRLGVHRVEVLTLLRRISVGERLGILFNTARDQRK